MANWSRTRRDCQGDHMTNPRCTVHGNQRNEDCTACMAIVNNPELSRPSISRAVLIVADLIKHLAPPSEGEFPFDPIALTNKIAAAIDATVEEALQKKT